MALSYSWCVQFYGGRKNNEMMDPQCMLLYSSPNTSQIQAISTCFAPKYTDNATSCAVSLPVMRRTNTSGTLCPTYYLERPLVGRKQCVGHVTFSVRKRRTL